jgi:hypothetical protein
LAARLAAAGLEAGLLARRVGCGGVGGGGVGGGDVSAAMWAQVLA